MANEALDTLLERRSAFLAFLRKRVPDDGVAEDILQTAYLRALKHSESLQPDGSVVAWFYSVLRHALIDHHRRGKTEDAAMNRWATELGLSSDAPERAAADAQTWEIACGCVHHVLESLRPAYADVLREVDLAEAPLSEFARKHELTASNAAVRAHRARAALKRELARWCGACSVHSCLDCTCKVGNR